MALAPLVRRLARVYRWRRSDSQRRLLLRPVRGRGVKVVVGARVLPAPQLKEAVLHQFEHQVNAHPLLAGVYLLS